MSTRRWEVRAVRGATTARANDAESIVEATGELIEALLQRNAAQPEDLISVIFTTTPDLNAAFPAAAARGLGMSDVPLLCAQEIDVPDALAHCIRVLVHLRTRADGVEHVYLRGARALRTDLAQEQG